MGRHEGFDDLLRALGILLSLAYDLAGVVRATLDKQDRWTCPPEFRKGLKVGGALVAFRHPLPTNQIVIMRAPAYDQMVRAARERVRAHGDMHAADLLAHCRAQRVSLKVGKQYRIDLGPALWQLTLPKGPKDLVFVGDSSAIIVAPSSEFRAQGETRRKRLAERMAQTGPEEEVVAVGCPLTGSAQDEFPAPEDGPRAVSQAPSGDADAAPPRRRRPGAQPQRFVCDVFISHRKTADRIVALAAGLLRARGLRVFIDDDSIPGGTEFRQVIDQAVRGSELFAIYQTADAGESINLKAELEAALSSRNAHRHPDVLVCLTPGASRPLGAEPFQSVDVGSPEDPRAAERLAEEVLKALRALRSVAACTGYEHVPVDSRNRLRLPDFCEPLTEGAGRLISVWVAKARAVRLYPEGSFPLAGEGGDDGGEGEHTAGHGGLPPLPAEVDRDADGTHVTVPAPHAIVAGLWDTAHVLSWGDFIEFLGPREYWLRVSSSSDDGAPDH